jgi:cystathionine beta-synthase
MQSQKKERKIYNNILETIGNTPVIRINKLTKELGIECEVLVKCEFFNPSGSHKDRLALNLINTAEAEGKLKPGGTIIEATSGNTGLGLCLVATVKGYNAIMVAQPKTSQEKIDLIKGLGAEVVMGRSSSTNDPEGVLQIAEKLNKSIPNSFYTEQFSNPANPVTHIRTTGIEVYEQCGGKIDYFFMAAGTGGTISGVGKILKEKNPNIKVIGCDPVGSIIGSSGTMYMPFKVEGVGRDVVPPNCDRSIMDDWVKFTDKDAFDTARKVMKLEGIMCGGSAGGILWSALHYAMEKKLDKSKTIVAFLPDTSRNYLTRFVNNEWLLGYGFINEEEYRRLAMESRLLPEEHYGDDIKLADLPCRTIEAFPSDTSLSKVWPSLKKERVIIVRDNDASAYKGLLTDRDALGAISTKKVTFADPISKVMTSDFYLLNRNLKVSTAEKILENKEYILFEDEVKSVKIARTVDIMNKLDAEISIH